MSIAEEEKRLSLRGVLLNYRSIAVAKGLLKTNFGGKPFCSVSYC